MATGHLSSLEKPEELLHRLLDFLPRDARDATTDPAASPGSGNYRETLFLADRICAMRRRSGLPKPGTNRLTLEYFPMGCPRLRHHLIALALSLCIGAAATQTMAHSSRISSSATGLPIPSLTHGEMAIIAPYQRQIINLALSAYDTHEPFRRVLNFAEIQYTACLWGMMPGGVTDEASPFNECAHAYLAAAKAVLLAMRDMPQEKIRASAIVSRIDSDMALSGLSLITCQFSGETFNTAEVISPEWTAVPSHAPSVMAFAALLVGSCGLGWGSRRLLGNQTRSTPKVSH